MTDSRSTIQIAYLLLSPMYFDYVVGAGGKNTCFATTPDILGPYYMPNAPERDRYCQYDPEYDNLPKLIVEGYVYDDDCQRKLPNSTLEIWQANHQGSYENTQGCRGIIRADRTGFYRYHTIHPGKYTVDFAGIYKRPSHIHYRVTTSEGHQELVTQMYFDGDTNLGKNDGCSVCKSSQPDLIVASVMSCTGSDNTTCTMVANFDIYLKRKHPFTIIPTVGDSSTRGSTVSTVGTNVYPHFESTTQNQNQEGSNSGCLIMVYGYSFLICIILLILL